MELERSIVQGTFLVIRKPQEDTFNICRLDQNIYLRENEQYKITWLKKTKNRNEYLIMSNGIIMSENILCEIKLKKISRFKYKLLHLGEKFIEREMKYALEEDGIDIRCTAFNRSNFTIDSILLGKPEETCIENGSGNVDFKEDSVSPNLQEKLFKRKVTTYNEDKENNCQPHIEKKKELKELRCENIFGEKCVDGDFKGRKKLKRNHACKVIVENMETDLSEEINTIELHSSAHDKNNNERKMTNKNIIFHNFDSELENKTTKQADLFNKDEERNSSPNDSPYLKKIKKIKLKSNEDKNGKNISNDTVEKDETSQTDLCNKYEKNNMNNNLRGTPHLRKTKKDKKFKRSESKQEKKLTSDTVEEETYPYTEKLKHKVLTSCEFNKALEFEEQNTAKKNVCNKNKKKNISPRDTPRFKKTKKKMTNITGSKQEKNISSDTVEEEEEEETSPYTERLKQRVSKLDEFNSANIVISKSKKKNGKRVYDKRHSCFICHEKCIKMARHLELVHHNELSVTKLLAHTKTSKLRKLGFIELIRTGDFYHNMEVLSSKSGQLILCRRPPDSKHVFNEFGPCPHCLGFMLKSQLWVHVRKCPFNKTENKLGTKSARLESDCMVNAVLCDTDENFRKYILNPLKNDDISTICKQDTLILGFATMLYEKHGTTQNELVRQSMRQLGRLLIELRTKNPTLKSKNLAFFIQPMYFDLIIHAVKSMCQTHSKDLERTEIGIPSLALKIGHSLKKCIGFLRGKALRLGNLIEDTQLQSFLNLLEMEWHIRISSHALATMVNKKMNAVELLPMTSDLLKLNIYISKEIGIFKVLLEKNSTETYAWFRLAECVLCRIILFNKRRGGEVSRMTLLQYCSTMDWEKESTQELMNSLTSFEKSLAKRLKLIQIRGKRGRTVPVLLTDEMSSAIDLLITNRHSVGVAPTNMYVFARPYNKSLSYIRGPDALRKISNKAELECAKSVTSTKLRKYMATVCQVFNLKDNEMDWLARHLGHDIHVHRNFYRLHESAVEVTKISRLLMAVDDGIVSKFGGKSLNGINLDDLPEIEVESCDEEVDSDDDNSNIYDESFMHRSSVKKVTKSKEVDYSTEFGTSSSAPKRKTRKFKSHRPWNNEEVKSVTTFFRVSIKKNIVPRKRECEECKTKYKDILEKRTWTDIKYFIKNYISRISKIKK